MTHIAEIRAFNRFYTRLLGVLDEHINRSPYSLAEGRVLYEIANRGNTSAAELARDLGIDPAYLSRLLQKLIGAELVQVSPSFSDKRSNRLVLSQDGDAAFAALDAGSEAGIAALLEPLSEPERDTLRAAMLRIQTLLGGRPASQSPLILRQPRIGDIGWLVHRQGVLYNQQFGWNAEFEALIAGLYRDFQFAPANPPRALWVAERGGVILGSVFVTPSHGLTDSAQLRMLYVEPEGRGQGLGRTLVDQAVTFARDNGYARMRLWTQSVLVSARRIYAGAGFELVDSEPHHSFGKDLVGENWELRF
jgi:DNA-binding MarR family transcriptional regulator/GNAT superfamily N-acetyltransferase